jgi:hypothetical protein
MLTRETYRATPPGRAVRHPLGRSVEGLALAGPIEPQSIDPCAASTSEPRAANASSIAQANAVDSTSSRH